MSGEPGRAISPGDLAEVLERGALDVLVDLLRASPDLAALLPDLLRDERIAVRLGASALVEELAARDPEGSGRAAARALAPLLADPSPVVRGDAAYLVGTAGDASALPALERAAAGDENRDVREIAAEAAERIRAQAAPSGW